MESYSKYQQKIYILQRVSSSIMSKLDVVNVTLNRKEIVLEP